MLRPKPLLVRTVAFAVMAVFVAAVRTSPAAAVTAYPPDPSYQTNGRVKALDLHGGVAYLGGDFTAVRPPGAAAGESTVPRLHAAAFDATTGALLAWDPRVVGTVDTIAVQDGIAYLGGNFTEVRGQPRLDLAAVDATTGQLLPWAPPVQGSVKTIAFGPNGNLFIGGAFSKIAGKQRWHIAEVTPDGALVAWAPRIGQVTGFACPPRCSPRVLAIDFSEDGKTVYFGGHFGLVNGVERDEAAAVALSDASVLRAWDPDVYAPANCPTCQTVETSRVYELIVYDSKAYMCGGFWKADDETVRSFNVYVTDLVNGKKDPTFAVGTDGDTPACAIRDGVMYLGGHFDWVGAACSQNAPGGTVKCTSENSTRRQHVAAVDVTTGALLPWNPGANSHTGLWELAAGGVGIAAGGDFTKIGAVAQQGFAKFTGTRLPA